MNIIKRLIRIVALNLKKRRLKKKLKLYSNTSASNGLSKSIVSDGANVTLNMKTKELVEKVKSEVSLLVNQSGCDIEKLLGYVKASKTNVYFLRNSDKLLKNIGEEQGFICEKKGFDALYLSFITMSGLSFKTKPVMVFEKGKVDKYLVLYAFYKWYSMKSGLGGFENKIQKKYNKYLKNISHADMSNLTLDEIVGLQEAIARDSEATEYVLTYEKENAVSKKLSKKISQDGGANI